jgi:iron complex transport system permease protein
VGSVDFAMGTVSAQPEQERSMPALRPRSARSSPVGPLLCVLLILLFLASLLVGRYSIPWRSCWRLLTGREANALYEVVLLQVRLPRIIAAILVGGGLSVSGAAYQGLFNNPMVSPDILGASAGACFGAALGILLGVGIFGIQAASFCGGLTAVLLVWALTARVSRRGDPILVLVLVGILVGSVFAALVSLIKFVSDPYSKLPAITFWLMGSLASINPVDARLAAVPIVAGIVPLILLRWRLNVLSFGEEEARAMGVDTGRLRFVVILCATLITAASVSIAGMVGWVGLVIPHLARMIVGPNHKRLVPASVLMGSCFLLLVDDIARLAYSSEIPLGILTSLIGAPFFLYLLLRADRQRA